MSVLCPVMGGSGRDPGEHLLGGAGVEGVRRRDRGSADAGGIDVDSVHRRTDAGLAGTVEPVRKCPGREFVPYTRLGVSVNGISDLRAD